MCRQICGQAVLMWEADLNTNHPDLPIRPIYSGLNRSDFGFEREVIIPALIQNLPVQWELDHTVLITEPHEHFLDHRR